MEEFSKPELMARKVEQQKALLDWIDADPGRKATYGDPFAAIEATIARETSLYPRYFLLDWNAAERRGPSRRK